MSAIPYDSHEQDWDRSDQEPFEAGRRPRRRFFNRRSAALAAVITCATGFYAGIRVEKGQLSSTASAATTTATGAATGARTGLAAGGAGAAGGFAARFGGAGGAGASGVGGTASLGTISSVNGNTIYLTDTTGNTVKVTLSSSTQLTKSQGVSKSALHPGDSVVIQGVKNSSGTVVATSVSDSGARTTASGSGSGSSATGG